ncbi:hypothetical protein [Hyperthermus butylicus]|uniref:Uncharacterized protein n=1 Tax=Hyperthermus butylicus (strain DSM 5456 / JCM 9403 / PLM1-5) TaxID=415426 RepID=A2BLH6_HYPBU|nr:hypothetical protein [Hyperthermus butylicus]ABM80837.1 hypothetical protein Hbut_0990 [Hyperthermus butylicus DSM 5456]
MPRRKSIMLDEEHARILQELATRYGVTISGYVRSLVEAAAEAEERGFHAPSLIRRALLFEALARLGAVPVPRTLLGAGTREARVEGERLGAALRELGLDVSELISLITDRLGLGIVDYNRVLIFRGSKDPLVGYVVGLASGYGLRVVEREKVIVIELGHE